MDFHYTEEQQALADLTEQIIGDQIDHAGLRELEASGERIDRTCWKALADAGILTALLPESAGGAGVGMVGVGAVLEAVGKHAAPVPVYPSIVLGALAIAEFGSAEQQSLLAQVGAGELLLTAAIANPAAVTASADHVLSGVANFVPSGLDADHILVATTSGTYLIDPSLAGVTIEEVRTTTGYSEAKLTFDGLQLSADDLLGGAADEAHAPWIQARADAAICALTTGICEGALDLLGTYANERQQFNRVIASFQAVSQRAGDSYIDTEAVRLTARSAAFRLDNQPADAARALAVARWWAAEAGHRVVHASTHIHGGVGVDRDYPLHRHFLMSRQLELTFGNAEEQLETLGSIIATT